MAQCQRAVALLLALLLALAPRGTAAGNSTSAGTSERSEVQKEKFDIMYCKSGTCTVCCDHWCKDTCEGLKTEMEEAGCSCDTDPEAFTSESFCEEKETEFNEKYKDDPFEAKMARACTLGCDSCCKGSFLQVAGGRSLGRSMRHEACERCLSSKGI